jgi:type IV pilus assembly protein PilC
MPKYQYQARDSAGKSVTGSVTAEDVNEAARLIRREGKTVVAMTEESGAAAGKPPALPAGPRHVSGRKVPLDQVIYFATQLAVMVDTGVPLADALDGIAASVEHPEMKAVVQDVSEQVKGGAEFSAALDSHPKVFSKLFVALMRASEASGTMGAMLLRLSEYLEQDRETRNQIKGAMTYPICMLTFCIVVVVGLLVFILPRFEKIYEGKGAVLPLPTRMLLCLSNGIIDHWALLLVVGGVVGTGLYFGLRTPGGHILLDKLRISLPIFGPMTRKASLARSLRTMSTLVSTGVTMLDGLNLTAEVSGNYFFNRMWRGVADRAREGSTLSDELKTYPLIPSTVAQMIAAGEKTGKLSLVMNRVAGFCEDDLRTAVKSVTTMIEPMMIGIMGVIVGGIAMAMLLPVFSVARLIAK